MAILPTTVTSSSAGFQPAFPHVSTKNDRHADALACVAMIAATSLDDVFKNAEALGMPKTGPYNHWIDAEFLASLLATYGWVATVWKECTKVSLLPDLCIALCEYSEDWEVGRYVLIHKAKASHDAKIVTYAIDPSASDPKLQVRTDIDDVLAPKWFIGVHPMKPAASSTKK